MAPVPGCMEHGRPLRRRAGPFKTLKTAKVMSTVDEQPPHWDGSTCQSGSFDVSLQIQVPCQKVIGDYLCRLGGPKYLLRRRYVDP